MAKFVLTEQQYKTLVEDYNNKTLVIDADKKPGNSAGEKVKHAEDEIKNTGLVNDPKKVKYTCGGVDNNTGTTTTNITSESRIITRRQLEERRAQMLKDNSTVYSLKDFMRK